VEQETKTGLSLGWFFLRRFTQ